MPRIVIETASASLPEFVTTGPLAPGGEQSFIMATLGTTTFHCVNHANDRHGGCTATVTRAPPQQSLGR